MSASSSSSPVPVWVLGAALVFDLGLLFVGLLTGNTVLIVLGVVALVSSSFVVFKVVGDRSRATLGDQTATKPSK